jgi:hypothetical protein
MGAPEPYAVCYLCGATRRPAASYAFMSAARVVAAGLTLAVKPRRDRFMGNVAPLHGNSWT